jgi:coenzyme Q-binding protein COQ10
MTKHRENRILPFTPEQLFALVERVEAYPDFLPWMTKTVVSNRTSERFRAEVFVGYRMISDSYVCDVLLTPHRQIDIQYISGPFSKLENTWTFTPLPHGTQVDFYIDFEFSSYLLQSLMTAVFTEAIQRLMTAFEQRAYELYGAYDGKATS